VVPLNALLQERGHQTVGSGHAIAVQNFFENFSMMLMVGIYVLMTRAGLSAVAAATGFGVLVTLSIVALSWVRLGQKSNEPG
jgi:LPLT family lysophospholipid transporter-like MFS transporter